MTNYIQPQQSETAFYIEMTPAQRIWVVEKITNRGEQAIDFRYWVRFKDSVEWTPTKKGIFLRLNQVREELIPTLIKMTNFTNYGKSAK